MCRTTNVPPALKQAADKLNKDDKWIAQVDYDAFAEDVRRLGEQLEKNQGEADVKHLNKMVGWSNTCAFLGLVTMGLGVNFFSIVMLSTWTFTRWTMIAHHTCHGGYDKCHPQKVSLQVESYQLMIFFHFNNLFYLSIVGTDSNLRLVASGDV